MSKDASAVRHTHVAAPTNTHLSKSSVNLYRVYLDSHIKYGQIPDISTLATFPEARSISACAGERWDIPHAVKIPSLHT